MLHSILRRSAAGLCVAVAALVAPGCDAGNASPPPTPESLQGAWALDAGGASLRLTFDGYDYRREQSGQVVEQGSFGTRPIGDSVVEVGEPFGIEFTELVDRTGRISKLVDAQLETDNALVLVFFPSGVRERFVRVP